MKIASSQVLMESKVVHRENRQTKRSVQYQNYALQAGITTSGSRTQSVDNDNAFSEMRQKSLAYLLEWLFGRETKERLMKNHYLSETQNVGQMNFQVARMNYEEYVSMETASDFQTTGKVITSDGRELSFQMDVHMSSSFQKWYTRQEEVVQQSQMCDPLVINLDTDVAKISDQSFYFDLDADGIEEEIGNLDAGSGYLALDLNNDGMINDGSELFGTKSGDGFRDLARYDEDGNGWIDENDAVWDKLKIWVRDESGESRLYSLAQKGVGAIFLHAVSTKLPQYNMNGDTRSMIQNTGVFLYENGNAGTIQHVDHALFYQS